MDRGAWRAIVHEVTRVRHNLATFTFTFKEEKTKRLVSVLDRWIPVGHIHFCAVISSPATSHHKEGHRGKCIAASAVWFMASVAMELEWGLWFRGSSSSVLLTSTCFQKLLNVSVLFVFAKSVSQPFLKTCSMKYTT